MPAAPRQAQRSTNSSTSSGLLQLPVEILITTLRLLERQDLARTALVSTALCALAQPILFESVRLEPSNASSLIRARGRKLAASTAALLAYHTISLELYEHEHNRNPASPISRRRFLLDVLSACANKLLGNLVLNFSSRDEATEKLWKETVNLIASTRIRSRRVILLCSSWNVAQAVLLHMAGSLSELHWDGWSDSFRYLPLPETFSPKHLTALTFRDLSESFVLSPTFRSLLKTVAPHLRSLALSGLYPIEADPFWTPADCGFSHLTYFYCNQLPDALYLAIVKASPKLEEIDVHAMGGLASSLLETFPPTWKSFTADLYTQQDSPDTLLTKIKRFRNPQSFPGIQYVDITQEEQPAVLLLKEALIKHFKSLGIEGSTQQQESVLTWDVW
ncbi:hypothetical protein P389DRAFT_8396 [Cystobasidium minutum MCA 4210]|uniref:uncharacterized protein n=1 Tax=Cystobasidium minutum MCA 4210 TaxID=1397322 RepID=UPI0034CDF9BD|eukprot:jgi/Rhomi1/8396/CE8395_239